MARPRTTPSGSGSSMSSRTPCGALGLDVEAVELTPAGKRRILRVAVDGDGGRDARRRRRRDPRGLRGARREPT